MSLDTDLTGLTESSWREAWDSTWRLYERRVFTAMSIVADIVAGIVIVAKSDPSRGENLLLGAGGAAVFGVVVWLVLFGWNFTRAPYRQRDRARRRLIAIIAIDPIVIEPFPDGRPAYLRITNQGPAGIFRVHLRHDTGREYYLGWEDGRRDRRLFTGETGEVFIARLDKDAKWQGGYAMVFFTADEEEPTMQTSWRVDRDATTLRATVLSDVSRPAVIDLHLGAHATGEKYWGAEIVLARGLFDPME